MTVSPAILPYCTHYASGLEFRLRVSQWVQVGLSRNPKPDET